MQVIHLLLYEKMGVLNYQYLSKEEEGETTYHIRIDGNLPTKEIYTSNTPLSKTRINQIIKEYLAMI